jgi:hypothetical protein
MVYLNIGLKNSTKIVLFYDVPSRNHKENPKVVKVVKVLKVVKVVKVVSPSKESV